MRTVSLLVVLVALPALPCSLAPQPNNPQPVTDGGIAPLADAGVDLMAPTQVVIDSVTLNLFDGTPCNGDGVSCPQLDSLRISLSATDDRTAVADLRYAVSFGATESEAASAPFTLVVDHDFTSTNTVSSYLGFNRARSGENFARQNLCFTLSAVDAAANVGPRSAARCLDTTSSAQATLSPGSRCGVPMGCSSSGAWPTLGLALVALSRRLRRSARSHRG